ncbi:MAG: carboxyl-terminal protease [Ignavibacteria bacterium]|nr:MAG: carboxyl-terminal protease [Ignavibacteria bacterium]KAF0160955.1 MAG: carboxyl-terminal protease [Ignavibacteria bacterium]
MRKIFLLFLFFVVAGSTFAQDPSIVLKKDHKIDTTKVIVPDEFYKQQSRIILNMLRVYQFKKPQLNDSLSSAIFNEYLKNLDVTKSYFLKSDVEQFEKYRFMFDDMLNNGSLEIPFQIFDVFKRRVNERIEYVKKALQKEFDFTVNEFFRPDREKAEWAKTVEELDEIWRLRLKSDALGLVLSNKEPKKVYSDLLKRYQNFHKVVLQYEAEDVFSIYINSFTQIIDPHTDYFSPANSDNFNIAMRLSLEGIGATLRQDGDFTTVASVVQGGPAQQSNLINNEDRIVGVAQGEDGEMVDVIGWRLDDVIQLIRGKKGTLVRLQILKKEEGDNALPKEIKLVRDKVKLEEQAAKSDVLNFEHNGKQFKIGVINLPTFYTDFEGQRLGKPDYKSTTRDVKSLITKLKEEKVDGIIMDLRGNGGGSLQEAILLTGLFIKEGPVVQVKNTNNIIEVNRDPDTSIFFDGALAVMVNRSSASASEIFAGAIQDYGRGVIIGEKTWGKGTVQNMIDLGMMIRTEGRKAGQIKLTQAMFYRINGSSTQRKGVTPDIQFPSHFEINEFGEEARPSALAWDQIQAADYKPYFNLSNAIKYLGSLHESRAKNDPEFLLEMDEINNYKKVREQKEFSLNIAARKTEREIAEAEKKKREDERAKLLGLKVEDKKEVSAEPAKIPSDYDLRETGRILADFILSKNRFKLVTNP